MRLRVFDKTWWPHKSLGEVLSYCVLFGVFFFFFGQWVVGHQLFLWDTDFQNDDAKIHLFAFHQFEKNHPLAEDPVANESLILVPPAFEQLYKLIVPHCDLFVASKIVQVLALILIILSGFYLMMGTKGRVVSGILFLFFIFHTPEIVNRIAGGLQRSFGFPILILWMIGVYKDKIYLRLMAHILGALFYPTALAISLMCEGLLLLWGTIFEKCKIDVRIIQKTLILIVVPLILFLPFLIHQKSTGTIITYEQALKDSSFSGRDSRIDVLPFKNPVKEMSQLLLAPLSPRGQLPNNIVAYLLRKIAPFVGIGVFLGLVIIGVKFKIQLPKVSLILFFSGTIIYFLARIFAFKLYLPEYYYQYTFPLVGISLFVEILGPYLASLSIVRRNLLASLLMIVLLCFWGVGFKKNNGMSINRVPQKELYSFIQNMPLHVRFAAHPMDGDNINYWGKRASLTGYEQLHPWVVEPWEKGQKRTYDALNLLYATRRDSLLQIARKEGITHLLINKDRYEGDILRKAMVFEPFNAFLRELLQGIKAVDLVLAHIPQESIIYENDDYLLLDIQKLKKIWTTHDLDKGVVSG